MLRRRSIDSVRSWQAPLSLAAVWLVAFVISGCGHRPAPVGTEGVENDLTPFAGTHPIQVVATTGPVTDMVRSIGGEHLNVAGLMGPGVDPHLYSELPADIERLAAADMIFYNGLQLEGRMANTFERLARRKPVFAVTDQLVESQAPELRKPAEFDGYYDPHLWHDAQLWSKCAEYVAEVLSKFDPAHRDDYAANLARYQNELREADDYARQRLATIPEEQRVLVTAHDAFGYFCPAYGLTPMALKGVSTDEEVSIGRLEDVVEFLVAHKIKAVFVESAVAPQIVNALIGPANKAGHTVVLGGELYADALGSASSSADTTPGMIRANVDTIVAALTDTPDSNHSEQEN